MNGESLGDAALKAPLPERPRLVSTGAVFVSVGLASWFAGLVGIYLLARASTLSAGGEWLGGAEIPLHSSNVMLATLACSVVVAHWAHWAIVRDDRRHAYLALFLLLVFGVAYINATTWQYEQMGLVAAESVSALLVYVITGSHLVATVGAMLAVGVTAFRALAGEYTPDQHDGVVATVIVWDVVVALFGVIWFAIYITK